MTGFLKTILADVRAELESAKARLPHPEIRRMLGDARPPLDLAAALGGSFGLIAEIKERSPSVGAMRRENVDAAPSVYEDSAFVRAISVLTNATHFGMSVECLAAMRARSAKPLLRKDFLIEEYQVREARAFGADAILLMANVLDASRLGGFHDLARELGMQVLFEVHEEGEIAALPADARIVGINSRKFRSDEGFVRQGEERASDLTLDFSVFALAGRLPQGTLKVAESGLTPGTIADAIGPFDAALVGTSLLRDPRGIAACLSEFESAIRG
jgi:indole-3-glycerol phosphate synthase